MLVLGRKVGEEIRIGDNVRLVVLAIRGSQVRLGFEASQDVTILRNEIHAKYDENGSDVHQDRLYLG